MGHTSIYHERNFSRDAEFVVAKPFVCFDPTESLRPGQPFDKQRVSTRLLRMLYEQRKITQLNGAVAVPKPPPPPPKPKTVLKHQGFGRYVVMRGDDILAGPMKRAEAEAEFVKLSGEPT